MAKTGILIFSVVLIAGILITFQSGLTSFNMGGSQSTNKPPSNALVVDEINERVLGKLIIDFIGNEGSPDLTKEQSLRTTLQHAITFLETQPEQVWKDAELEIVDKSGEMFKIFSGNGGNKFTLYYDGEDKVQFHCERMVSSRWFGWLWEHQKSRL